MTAETTTLIAGKASNWIASLLHGHRQRVILNGTGSAWSPVLSGVPQGTVVRPILFPIYINDTTRGINSRMRLFADDNIIYWEIHSIYWPLEAAKWHHQTPILVWKMADDLAPGGISSEWSNIEIRTWKRNYLHMYVHNCNIRTLNKLCLRCPLDFSGINILTIWRNFLHWLHRNSKWQPLVLT